MVASKRPPIAVVVPWWRSTKLGRDQVSAILKAWTSQERERWIELPTAHY